MKLKLSAKYIFITAQRAERPAHESLIVIKLFSVSNVEVVNILFVSLLRI